MCQLNLQTEIESGECQSWAKGDKSTANLVWLCLYCSRLKISENPEHFAPDLKNHLRI